MLQWVGVGWLLNLMMQCVTNTLNIKGDWSSLLLDITEDVVVVLSLNPGSESNLDGHLVVGSDHSRHRRDLQGIGVFRITSDGLLVKREIEGNVLKILDMHNILVLSLQQQWTEVDLTHINEDIRVVHLTNEVEILLNTFLWNLKQVVGLMGSGDLWSVLKDDLELLSREDNALLSHTLEETATSVTVLVFLLNSPLEGVAAIGGVHHVESLDVLDLGSDGLELDDVVLGIQVFFFLTVVRSG